MASAIVTEWNSTANYIQAVQNEMLMLDRYSSFIQNFKTNAMNL